MQLFMLRRDARAQERRGENHKQFRISMTCQPATLAIYLNQENLLRLLPVFFLPFFFIFFDEVKPVTIGQAHIGQAKAESVG